MFVSKTLGRAVLSNGVRSINPAMQRVPNMGFNSAAAVALRPRESIRAREDRKRELTKLMESWVCKVGFEFHVQLKSKHKMFSTSLCSNLDEPNTNANFVDIGLPGMLPVLNENCLDIAIKASLALGGRILPQIKFDRKHYIYADLPQAYQITQKHYPIMLDGRLFYYDY
jgi:aspartyl-tRNA(Asn)/glutamyl-tRNA(Gln) amidotransferase subunit B